MKFVVWSNNKRKRVMYANAYLEKWSEMLVVLMTKSRFQSVSCLHVSDKRVMFMTMQPEESFYHKTRTLAFMTQRMLTRLLDTQETTTIWFHSCKFGHLGKANLSTKLRSVSLAIQ